MFNRPGQRGTTGQLIFDKCEDPPAKCSCEEEPKPSNYFKFINLIRNNYYLS